MPIHVDGASGGFLAPFCAPDLRLGLPAPAGEVDQHLGAQVRARARSGVGWVVWRDDKDELPDELIFNVNYLGGNMPTFALNFSRPGGQIVAQYYNFLRLGREGYRKLHQSCYETAQYLAERDRVARSLRDDVRRRPEPRDPGGLLEAEGGHVSLGFTLFDLADRLRTSGWQVPAYSMPANREDLVVQRILVRQGFSRDLGELLMRDYRDALSHFDAHPVSSPLSEAEAGSFHH